VIVICGHPAAGNGIVWINDNGHVYQMQQQVSVPPREDQILTIDGKVLDAPEWWFESAKERSH